MKYQPRPGVILVSICKTPVLIPTREAYSHCPRVQKLPLTWAILWDALSNGKPIEKVVEAYRLLSGKSEEEIREKLENICHALCEKGYMIEIPEDSDGGN